MCRWSVGANCCRVRVVCGTGPIDDDCEDGESAEVLAWQKAADDQKRKGDVYNPLLGAGMERLPGACRSGKCRHAAHLR